MIAALITNIFFVTNELDNQTKTQGKYKLKYGLTGRLISFLRFIFKSCTVSRCKMLRSKHINFLS